MHRPFSEGLTRRARAPSWRRARRVLGYGVFDSLTIPFTVFTAIAP